MGKKSPNERTLSENDPLPPATKQPKGILKGKASPPAGRERGERTVSFSPLPQREKSQEEGRGAKEKKDIEKCIGEILSSENTLVERLMQLMRLLSLLGQVLKEEGEIEKYLAPLIEGDKKGQLLKELLCQSAEVNEAQHFSSLFPEEVIDYLLNYDGYETLWYGMSLGEKRKAVREYLKDRNYPRYRAHQAWRFIKSARRTPNEKRRALLELFDMKLAPTLDSYEEVNRLEDVAKGIEETQKLGILQESDTTPLARTDVAMEERKKLCVKRLYFLLVAYGARLPRRETFLISDFDIYEESKAIFADREDSLDRRQRALIVLVSITLGERSDQEKREREVPHILHSALEQGLINASLWQKGQKMTEEAQKNLVQALALNLLLESYSSPHLYGFALDRSDILEYVESHLAKGSSKEKFQAFRILIDAHLYFHESPDEINHRATRVKRVITKEMQYWQGVESSQFLEDSEFEKLQGLQDTRQIKKCLNKLGKRFELLCIDMIDSFSS